MTQTTRVMQLVLLAQRTMLTPQQAVALPAAVAIAARKLDMDEAAFIQACLDKPAVGSYLAMICRNATA